MIHDPYIVPALPADWPFEPGLHLLPLGCRVNLDLPGLGGGWRVCTPGGIAPVGEPIPLSNAFGRGGIFRVGDMVLRPYRRGGLLRHVNERTYRTHLRFAAEHAVHRGLWEAGLTNEQKEILKPLSLLTAKPVLYAANVSEDELSGAEGKYLKTLREAVKASGEMAEIVPFSAKIEAELSELSAEERGEFLASLGIESAGLDRLIRAAYLLLGLQTYFTAGPKEVRAWTIHKGDTAPKAAGVIHTDFERGFIRAETIAFNEYIACGGEKVAKEKGLMRSEGKEYVVQDGDVMLFRFNV